MSMIIDPFKFDPGPPPGGHRYWRVHITANDGGSFMGFTEIQMRAALAGADMTDPQGGTASAAQMACQNSSAVNTDNGAWYAVDDNFTTSGWLSNGASDEWWSYDFSLVVPGSGYTPHGPVDIIQIAITASYNDLGSSPADFTLEWSDDNAAWTTAMTVTGQTWTTLETKVFDV